MGDYLPHREADLVTWANTFDGLITATPTDFGLDAAQATAFAALNSAWVTAYTIANGNGTRTPASIQTKNDAKEALIRGPGGIRELVAIIQAFPGTTNTERSQLGISIRDDEPTPVPIPSDAPEIDFIATGTRTIRIRLHNENSLNRAKPEGVSGATVFSYVGTTPPASLSDWKFERNTTKTLIDIIPPVSVPSGTDIWFTAFWRNPKDESGPACTPQRTVVQYGGMSQAA